MRRSWSIRSFPPGQSAPPIPVERRRIGRSRVPLHRRLLIARTAFAYWFAVLVLALLTGAAVSRLASQAAAAERRLGTTGPALVAVRALRPGERLTSAVVRVEQRPAAQLPERALTHIPRDASASGPVAPGEVLTDVRLEARSGASTEGTVTMAVPLGDAPLMLRSGDRVDVFATYDPSLAPAQSSSTSRVVERAAVVRSGHASVTIAVRPQEATTLATALARSTITLALVR